MKKLFTLAVAAVLLTACGGTINGTRYDFKDNRWPATEVVHLDVASPGSQLPATLSLTYSHVHDPQFTDIPLQVDITAPDGTKETIPVVLHLKDAAGQSLSDCAGDVCDFNAVVKKIESPQQGEYKIDIRNKFSAPYLPNTLAVGVNFSNLN